MLRQATTPRPLNWGRGVTRNNGSTNAHARWTEAQVRDLRQRYGAGATFTELARAEGCSRFTVRYAVLLGWKHL